MDTEPDTVVGKEEEKWDDEDGENPYELYILGECEEAAPLLKKLANDNCGCAQLYYADIKFRGLDGKPRSFEKAAMWYTLAALNDIDDAVAVGIDEVNGFMEMGPEGQMAGLVAAWSMRFCEDMLGRYNDYDSAASYFVKLAEHGGERARELHAIARQRDLQEGRSGHEFELASAYVISAHLGVNLALDYIKSKAPGLMQLQTPEEQVEALALVLLVDSAKDAMAAVVIAEDLSVPINVDGTNKQPCR